MIGHAGMEDERKLTESPDIRHPSIMKGRPKSLTKIWLSPLDQVHNPDLLRGNHALWVDWVEILLPFTPRRKA